MRVAVTSLLVVANLLGLSADVHRAANCDGSQAWTSCPNAVSDGSQVDVGAGSTSPGSGGGSSGGGDGGASQQEPPGETMPECTTELCRGGYTVVGLPDVTLADIASFVPAQPTLGGEPTGLGVVAMPTNVVASATEQRMAGRVLDYDVTVRFVPQRFVFSYGDGSSKVSETGGASWRELGQAEFTSTPTSHSYGASGNYSASVTVEYAASVDFGSGNWRAVPGVVESTASGYGIRVVEVHTALVDKTCLENPSGVGC
ncbi:hypothetical protein FHX49_002409 [Microbacterium endophyticum]|uniref:PKD domain-containing protein n=1 Tax=Microbacterium endophyticum TaxID=1526412 RepID=A0A7W4YN35_9MICO|nr:hypothetical protein [Microbacterium endophyticum]MBB2976823.1 hypothetical protein [Microbacterium endophyticum]NIK36540.1 hypothetical protein [Microbacterium endophyticum]